MSVAVGFSFFRDLRMSFEIAVVNEPSVFEPLKFYYIFHFLIDYKIIKDQSTVCMRIHIRNATLQITTYLDSFLSF